MPSEVCGSSFGVGVLLLHEEAVQARRPWKSPTTTPSITRSLPETGLAAPGPWMTWIGVSCAIAAGAELDPGGGQALRGAGRDRPEPEVDAVLVGVGRRRGSARGPPPAAAVSSRPAPDPSVYGAPVLPS